MQLARIHHVAIICADYERSKRFYTEVLGLRIVAENYRAARASHKLDLALPDGSQIELFSFPEAPARATRPEAQGLRHLSFEVHDVRAAADELVAQGIVVEPLRVDEYTGRRFTFFADPDGLPLELYEAAPAENLDALLLKLEGALHLREVRASAVQIEELLDDDFRELGVSGTEWTRPAIIDALRDEAFSERTISEFRVQRMAPDIALVTYRAHRAAIPERAAADSLRSSLWRLRHGRWRMVFHQGTPL
ncbi:glyoxylase I family protein [Variovorax boronicumulans]|uniref:Glyoxylase I family protein n=1 Tax=Variovorax boronicumulans TaxID=436515 RepID=A0AAW8D0P5_9BURK|nr:VOC family protein [Variovorax boronicumulans]MDP9893656.1 glyoxylase I family protein [Variovorax boronicumulans]MDQ0053230.1 glyoxylase I family protein [Variovorax boronicumulans]